MKRILLTGVLALGLIAGAAGTASAGQLWGVDTAVVGGVEYNWEQENFNASFGGEYTYTEWTLATETDMTYDTAAGFDFVGSTFTASYELNENLDVYTSVDMNPGFVFDNVATGVSLRF